MRFKNIKYRNFVLGIWETWGRFWYVFHACHRIDDLQRLVKWAARKRLKVVQDSYRYKLMKELVSLKGCYHYYPETTTWGRGLYRLVRWMTPDAPYYARGAAAAYRTAK
jgi:hypothetical protein